MKCKKCREYILTDYLDDEAGVETKRDIEKHLSLCPNCNEFSMAAWQAVIEPFEKSERTVPPETVWQNIEEKITEQSIGKECDWVERFSNIFFPRLAFVMAVFFFLMSISIILTFGTRRVGFVRNNNYETSSEQIEYIAYLFDNNEDGVDGYGTFIEEYFL